MDLYPVDRPARRAASCGCCAATTTRETRLRRRPGRGRARASTRPGARWIHVVDLDAALDGGNPNLAVIEAICANVDAQRADRRRRALASTTRASGSRPGVHARRVGSAAVEHPEVVDELAALHPGQVAVGLDARGRDVAIHGWTDATGLDLVDARAAASTRPGVGALDRHRHQPATACSAAPTLDQLARGRSPRSPCRVIASGGVGTLDDLRALAALEVDGQRLAGAIVGRAIYENRFTVEEGIAACSPSA